MRKATCLCGTSFTVGDEGGVIVCPSCGKARGIPERRTSATVSTISAEQIDPEVAAAEVKAAFEKANPPAKAPAPKILRVAIPEPAGPSARLEAVAHTAPLSAAQAAPPVVPIRPLSAAAQARTVAPRSEMRAPSALQEPREPREPRIHDIPTPTSRLPAILAIGGIAFAFLACVLLLIGPLGKAPSKRAALQAERAILEEKGKGMERDRLLLVSTQSTDKAAFDAEKTRTTELKIENELLDMRFSGIAKNAGVQMAEQEHAVAEKARQETQKQVNAVIDTLDPVKTVARAEKSVVVVETETGGGSGFLISADGLAITNYHVVSGSTTLRVRIQQKGSHETMVLTGARVVAADAVHDLAMLQLPAAPDEVGENGAYAPVTFRKEAVRAAESVFVIGNPGMGAGTLDFTVTTGIISHPSRQLDKVSMIQTSAVVNPGNSGGPLFSADGRVIGVVRAKGVDVEAVTFAIPYDDLDQFIKSRKSDPFAVHASLREWEKTHVPEVGLVYAEPALLKNAMSLEAPVSAILPSSNGKFLYLLQPEPGKVLEVDIAARKVTRSVDAGTPLADLIFREGDLTALTADGERLLLIDTKRMALSGEARLKAQARSLSYMGSANQYTLLMNPLGNIAGDTYLVGQTDFARGGEVGIEMPRSILTLNSVSNGKWTLFSTLLPQQLTFVCRIYPTTQAVQAFSRWASTRNMVQPTQETLVRTAQAVLQQLDSNEKLCYFPRDPVTGVTGAGTLFFLGLDRFVWGQRVYSIGVKANEEGRLDDNVQLPRTGGQSERGKELHRNAARIVAVGGNGRWASNARTIFDTSTFKPFRSIPFLCFAQAFSPDGKTLYMLNGNQTDLIILPQWEKELPPPAK